MNPMQHPERPLTPTEPTAIQPDASDRKQAREELAELVSAGKDVGGIDLEACLELEMIADEDEFIADLTALLGSLYGNGGDQTSCASFWCRCLAYVERIAAKHIADDDVMDRAIATLNERDE